VDFDLASTAYYLQCFPHALHGMVCARNEIAQSIVAIRSHVVEESGTADTKKVCPGGEKGGGGGGGAREGEGRGREGRVHRTI
jgi:hypothetical protein